MGKHEEPGERRNTQQSAERTPAEPARARGDGSPPAGSNPQRQTSEPRRRRGNEPRYVGFADGLERVYCLGAEHLLPAAFPVAAHHGAATIARAVVARRGDTLLLCTFTHCGPHRWPDGEIVSAEEAQST